ncbi:Retinol dehydrogenase [Zostera marina]|uniref:Retinol dehydrogenase n=1 Tax=Zostera marina TaxID=29655 RepID=A0A0K9PE28_ZOSMR|nr:Retinol dehydrogenase [Zostera marina]
MGLFSLVTGIKGRSGYGSATTAEEVTQGIDAGGITAIVTGGASGIGEEVVRVLALRGAHIIVAARNMEAAEISKQTILESNPAAKLTTMKIDLSSLKSIRDFADNFTATNLPLNLLINNAGIMFCPYKLSEDGIEMQFATNHIGHFLLTNLLLEKMKMTAKETGTQGRIVNLSSVMHRYPYIGGVKFKTINEKSKYIDMLAYGQSKLANILHANELSRILQEEGTNITVNSVHPGVIMTKLMRYSSCLIKITHFFSFPLWKNVPQGAATTCYVALHPKVHGITGKYFCDCNETKASKLARNGGLAHKLWEFSEKMVRYK